MDLLGTTQATAYLWAAPTLCVYVCEYVSVCVYVCVCMCMCVSFRAAFFRLSEPEPRK